MTEAISCYTPKYCNRYSPVTVWCERFLAAMSKFNDEMPVSPACSKRFRSAISNLVNFDTPSVSGRQGYICQKTCQTTSYIHCHLSGIRQCTTNDFPLSLTHPMMPQELHDPHSIFQMQCERQPKKLTTLFLFFAQRKDKHFSVWFMLRFLSIIKFR